MFVSGISINDPKYMHTNPDDPYVEMTINACISTLPNFTDNDPSNDKLILDSQGLLDLKKPLQSGDACFNNVAKAFVTNGWSITGIKENPETSTEIITLEYLGGSQ